MLPPLTEEHSGFVIAYEPVFDPASGLYHARAEVRGCQELKGHMAILVPEVAPFPAAEDAAQFALAYAVRWIDSGVGWSDWPDSDRAPLPW
jgi:hypothetical protein